MWWCSITQVPTQVLIFQQVLGEEGGVDSAEGSGTGRY